MKIKELRESHQMTQSLLAKELGVCRSTLAMWETGKAYPSIKILLKLSELFSCTLDELVKGGQ